eukprot:7432133-Ditylum_brightwellii.AAC.1
MNSKSMPGIYSYLNKFVDMYNDDSNKQFKNVLVVCLLKAFVAKMSRQKNPVYSQNVFNFCLALSATSRKSFVFVSDILMGPAIQQIQRRWEQACRQPFIHFNESMVKERIRLHLIRLTDALGSGRPAFSFAIDGIKVAKTKEISH